MSPFGIVSLAAAVLGNGAITADRRLYLTADESTVVEENDESARFLLAAPGHTILAADVERLGLTVADDKVVLPDPPAPEKKQVAKSADKARTPSENK